MLPFEFVVIGTPVSHQTKDKKKLRKWKDTVRAGANKRWPSGDLPLNQPIQMFTVYYFEGAALDVDNMTKPIQDALKGLIYTDDCLVTDGHPAKRDLNGSFRVRGMSPVLAEGFCSGNEFIHVKILEAPNQEVLL
ncbi:MAG: RusA family crossover junction endodeoxyribonuclease [Dehalococcoidales bacterium]|nr:RusA family crossover junction endodeoxyribonuclease [Dehalococcoidales bacterium]